MTDLLWWVDRALFRRMAAGFTVFVTLAAGLLAVPESARAAATSSASGALDALSAVRQAAETGDQVEVVSERTEYTRVFAEPTGRFVYEAAVTPQRVRRTDGTWDDIDLTLAESGGVIRPKASAADVRFSAGGSGPLVTLVKGGRTLTLSWPLGELHEPDLSGAAATYANVLPDVDLVVRATRDGFSHVLVVKTAAAAADERIQQITFGLGGTAPVRRAADGSLAAMAGGVVIASAVAPVMWDSTTASAAVARSLAAAESSGDAGASVDPSTTAAPADMARTAPVGTSLNPDGDLVLKPDAGLLTSAKFPLFIDPLWSTGKSRWAYSTSNNSNNTDISRARVGKDPNSGVTYRSYFEFPISAIKLKYVHNAYVQTKVDHTYSCTNTPNSLLSTAPIAGTPRTAWKSSTSTTKWYLKFLAQVSSHANEGTGCDDSPQPDVTINFDTEAVRSVVQAGAKASASSITFVISAVDSGISGESTVERWKKYYPDDTKLITEVDAIPTKPTEQYVNGVRCGTATIGIGTTALKFSARMPDTDTTQSITATWAWEKLNGSTWGTMAAPATSSAAANTPASAVVSGGAGVNTYRFHVKGTDPYGQSSAFSDWCQFTIDTAKPPVDGVVVTQPAGPGLPGQFKMRSQATDVAKFRYGWSAAVTEILPAGTETVDGVTYTYVTVPLTAPKYGSNTLFVQAVDTTGNVGDGSLSFDVERASPPVARWRLETYPGVAAADALADQRADLAGDTPLTAAGVSFTDGQRMIGGAEATFTGASTLTTTGGIVDTTKSFGVAAWVKVNTLAGFQNFVAQDGDHVTNFQLQYRSDNNAFCFTMRGVDQDATTNASFACATGTPVAGRWTHLAGTFDASEKKMRVWVDGVLKQESAAPDAPWPSKGPLRIGNRKLTASSWTDNLSGAVTDVQVFDRALVQEDLTGDDTDPADAVEGERGMLNPIEVARWGFEDATPCYDPSLPDDGICEEPDNDTRFGRRLHLTQGVEVVSGANGNFAAFDDQQLYADDPTDPFYGTTTLEYGLSQRNAGDAATPNWQDTPVLRTDQSFTVSARVHIAALDHTMTALAQRGVAQSAFYLGARYASVNDVLADRICVMTISADTNTGEDYSGICSPETLQIDDSGVWNNITLVHDAGTHRMRLFVNGVFKDQQIHNWNWQATGPMIVGASWYSDDGEPAYITDPWNGGIDDVRIFQGAMTDAQVAALNAAMES